MKDNIVLKEFENSRNHIEFCGCNPFYDNPVCIKKIKKAIELNKEVK